jgi:8-oxo-dGTP diphosphatase
MLMSNQRFTDSAWQRAEYAYCPKCGTSLRRCPDSGRKRCQACGYLQYLNPIAVVAVILLSDFAGLPNPGIAVSPSQCSHILLVRRRGTEAGSWCIPCGYLEYNEDVRAAAEREMAEETGLIVSCQEVFAVHSNFHRPAEQSVGTWFLSTCQGGELRAGDDAATAEFFPLTQLPSPLAFPTDLAVLEKLRHPFV